MDINKNKEDKMSEEKNYFEKLLDVDVTDYIEKKNGLSYVSWSYAWMELKKHYPDSQYKIYENENGWNYFTDGRTAWVKTGIIVNGLEHIEYLPVMDLRNNAKPLNTITSTDVNKTIQRSLTKAIARHGLGIKVYAGEDLPEEAEKVKAPVKAKEVKAGPKTESKETFTSEEKQTIFSDNPAEWLELIAKCDVEKLPAFYKRWVLKFPKNTQTYNQLVKLAQNRKDGKEDIWEGVK